MERSAWVWGLCPLIAVALGVVSEMPRRLIGAPTQRSAEVVTSKTAEGSGITLRMPTMTYHCTGSWRKLCDAVEPGDRLWLGVERDPYRLTIRPPSGRWEMIAERHRAEFIDRGMTISFPLPAGGAARELRRRLDRERR
jgi:hypothetical protein